MFRHQLWIEKTAVWRGLVGLQKVILVALGAFSALLVTGNVLSRWILKIDIFANEEIITLATLWLYFIGAAYCSAVEGHIKADLLGHMVKSGVGKKIVKLVVEAITVFVGCFFTYYGYNYLVWCIERNGHTPGLNIPMVASQITLFIGITLMLIYTITRLIGYIMTPPSAFVSEDENKAGIGEEVSDNDGDKEER